MKMMNNSKNGCYSRSFFADNYRRVKNYDIWHAPSFFTSIYFIGIITPILTLCENIFQIFTFSFKLPQYASLRM